MAIVIAIENLQKKIRLNPAQISKIGRRILKKEGCRKATLSIVFVSSQKIRALNKKYLNRSYATDVLAFDLKEKKLSKEIVGDVIVSTDAAIKSTKIFKTSLAQELVLYIVHGILHLMGYDDHTSREKICMRKKEQEILDYLGSDVKKVMKIR